MDKMLLGVNHTINYLNNSIKSIDEIKTENKPDIVLHNLVKLDYVTDSEAPTFTKFKKATERIRIAKTDNKSILLVAELIREKEYVSIDRTNMNWAYLNEYGVHCNYKYVYYDIERINFIDIEDMIYLIINIAVLPYVHNGKMFSNSGLDVKKADVFWIYRILGLLNSQAVSFATKEKKKQVSRIEKYFKLQNKKMPICFVYETKLALLDNFNCFVDNFKMEEIDRYGLNVKRSLDVKDRQFQYKYLICGIDCNMWAGITMSISHKCLLN